MFFFSKTSLTVILKFQILNPALNKLWKSSRGRTSTFSRTFQDLCCWPSLHYQGTQHSCIRYRDPAFSVHTATSGVSASTAIPAQPLKEKLSFHHCLSCLFLFSFISPHWLKNVHLSKIKLALGISLGSWNLVLPTFTSFDFLRIHIHACVYKCIHTYTETYNVKDRIQAFFNVFWVVFRPNSWDSFFFFLKY